MLVVFVSAAYQLAAFVQLHSSRVRVKVGRGEKTGLGGREGIYLGSADWQNLKDNFQNSEGALLLKPIGCGAFSKY